MDRVNSIWTYVPGAWVVAGVILLALELVIPGGFLLWRRVRSNFLKAGLDQALLLVKIPRQAAGEDEDVETGIGRFERLLANLSAEKRPVAFEIAVPHVGEEIHPGETSEEKVSLSERFGLWISFYPFDQDEYLRIVDVWIEHFGVHGAGTEGAHKAALQWSLTRGSRSGRVAWQFARDWAGKQKLKGSVPPPRDRREPV